MRRETHDDASKSPIFLPDPLSSVSNGSIEDVSKTNE